jgi:hypothetical protein
LFGRYQRRGIYNKRSIIEKTLILKLPSPRSQKEKRGKRESGIQCPLLVMLK